MNVMLGSIAASAGIVLCACLYAMASEDSLPDTVHHYEGAPKSVVVATVQSQEAVPVAPVATYTPEERARLVEIQRQHTEDALGKPAYSPDRSEDVMMEKIDASRDAEMRAHEMAEQERADTIRQQLDDSVSASHEQRQQDYDDLKSRVSQEHEQTTQEWQDWIAEQR